MNMIFNRLTNLIFFISSLKGETKMIYKLRFQKRNLFKNGMNGMNHMNCDSVKTHFIECNYCLSGNMKAAICVCSCIAYVVNVPTYLINIRKICPILDL